MYIYIYIYIYIIYRERERERERTYIICALYIYIYIYIYICVCCSPQTCPSSARGPQQKKTRRERLGQGQGATSILAQPPSQHYVWPVRADGVGTPRTTVALCKTDRPSTRWAARNSCKHINESPKRSETES